MKKEPLSFFDRLSESIGWIGIVLSPLIVFAVIALCVYIASPTAAGGLVAIMITVVGLILGVLLASNVAAKTGTVHLLSRVSATPELDNLQSIYNEAYTFSIRPGHSGQPLIEFQSVLYGGDAFDPVKLVRKLQKLLSANGFREDKTYRQPVVDELSIRMISGNEGILIQLDNRNLVFISGENSPQAILNIERLLWESPHFKQLKPEKD